MKSIFELHSFDDIMANAIPKESSYREPEIEEEYDYDLSESASLMIIQRLDKLIDILSNKE